jgi:hypothetical protein
MFSAGQRVEQFRLYTQNSGMRAVPLIGRGCENIAANLPNINLAVDCEVHCVYKNTSAYVVRCIDDWFEIWRGTQQV